MEKDEIARLKRISNDQLPVYGNSVYSFRPITAEDLEQLYQWRRHPVVARFLESPPPKSMAAQVRWFEAYLDESSSIYFIVSRSIGDQEKLGYCQLIRIDYDAMSAEFGIIIGKEKLLGTGIGYSIAASFLALSFGPLAIRVVYGSNHPDNSGSNRFHAELVKSRLLDGPHPLRKKSQLLFELTHGRFRDFEAEMCARRPLWRRYFEIEQKSSFRPTDP